MQAAIVVGLTILVHNAKAVPLKLEQEQHLWTTEVRELGEVCHRTCPSMRTRGIGWKEGDIGRVAVLLWGGY